jgi:hypothetical protein
MPYFTGDPEWRYNVAGRPLFASPVGLLVYAGLGLAIWRIRRQPIYVLWLAVALVGLIPSLFTVQAPSFLRSIVILPAVMLFIAIGVERIAGLIARGHASQATWVFGLIAIVATAATDWPAYFIDWPQNDEVNSIYRDDLEQLATYLRPR